MLDLPPHLTFLPLTDQSHVSLLKKETFSSLLLIIVIIIMILINIINNTVNIIINLF
jgi:hypothetical protein